MQNPFGLRLDLANSMLTNAARFHELITQETYRGNNSVEVAITFDLLQSEIVHLKDRYDLMVTASNDLSSTHLYADPNE